MDAEDANFLSDILPYGQRMSILRLIIKDFIEEVKENPDVVESLLMRQLPRTTKVAVRRSLLGCIESWITITNPQSQEALQMLHEIRELLK